MSQKAQVSGHRRTHLSTTSNSSIINVVSDSTSRGGADSGRASEQDVDNGGPETRQHTDRDVAQRWIATAVGVDSLTVRWLLDQLAGDDGALDSILDSVLSDPDRLEAVRGTRLLDNAPHAAIDRIAQLTAEALGTPFASVALVAHDRQILVGCNVGETAFSRHRPLEMSLSKFAVVSGEPLIVDDAALHPLLADHPAVRTGVLRAYAGVPLIDDRGNAVGTLSTWDHHPHQWTSGQIQILNDLTEVACAHLFTAGASRPPVGRTRRKR